MLEMLRRYVSATISLQKLECGDLFIHEKDAKALETQCPLDDQYFGLYRSSSISYALCMFDFDCFPILGINYVQD